MFVFAKKELGGVGFFFFSFATCNSMAEFCAARSLVREFYVCLCQERIGRCRILFFSFATCNSMAKFCAARNLVSEFCVCFCQERIGRCRILFFSFATCNSKAKFCAARNLVSKFLHLSLPRKMASVGLFFPLCNFAKAGHFTVAIYGFPRNLPFCFFIHCKLVKQAQRKRAVVRRLNR